MPQDVSAALAQTRRELEESNRERRRLLERVFTAQEEERARVARDLHDDLSQILTSIALLVPDLESREGARREELTRTLHSLLHRAQTSIRDLMWRLRPPDLDEHGLAQSLDRLARDAAARLGIEVKFEAIGGAEGGSPEVVSAVFNVVQEALVNAVRHAHAAAVSIVLSRSASRLTVIVEDDGVGFDPATVEPMIVSRRAQGILAMRERASFLGGTLTIESAPGKGTTVRLMVPAAK